MHRPGGGAQREAGDGPPPPFLAPDAHAEIDDEIEIFEAMPDRTQLGAETGNCDRIGWEDRGRPVQRQHRCAAGLAESRLNLLIQNRKPPSPLRPGQPHWYPPASRRLWCKRVKVKLNRRLSDSSCDEPNV